MIPELRKLQAEMCDRCGDCFSTEYPGSHCPFYLDRGDSDCCIIEELLIGLCTINLCQMDSGKEEQT